MEATRSELRARLSGSTAFIVLVGRAHAAQTPGFCKVLREFQNQGALDVVLDMTDCTLLDSTFCGTLVSLASPPPPSKPVLCTVVNPPPMIVRQLDMLEVTPYVRVIHGSRNPQAEASASTVVEAEEALSREEIARVSLKAHQVLQGLSEANRLRFQSVVDLLAEEIAADSNPRPLNPRPLDSGQTTLRNP